MQRFSFRCCIADCDGKIFRADSFSIHRSASGFILVYGMSGSSHNFFVSSRQKQTNVLPRKRIQHAGESFGAMLKMDENFTPALTLARLARITPTVGHIQKIDSSTNWKAHVPGKFGSVDYI